ncbi:uncharacterized protein LOC107018461 [Solanum pennellii]|uniref:Uncharacterized protein LOC107018461 n=1 Tax=Solanum pennellii TaxID=28526 RepID=A0ABM1GQH0_SOLPN|nr:uncharacterized protein LOC107018461 [Solanum pennellii]
MVSLGVNPSMSLSTLNKIGTIQRRSTVSMIQMKHVGVVSASSLSLSYSRPLDRVANDDRIILSRNLDDWMNASMVDIVKNLKQAPLLVHIYANEEEVEDDDRESSRIWIKTERALFENWPMMKNEWESGRARTPDGLIFVEELRDDEYNEDHNILQEDLNLDLDLDSDSDEVLMKSWGVMVQGKGIDQSGAVCYLLKTSRVRAGRGMDLFCTHFCLVRVKNFRGSALKQFKSCWL